MTPKYKNLEQRALDGDYELIDPLDFRILDECPAAGSMVAGLYQLGTTSRAMSRVLVPLSASVIGSRCRVMHKQDLMKKVRLVDAGSKKTDGSFSWQRTEAGDKVLAEWKKGQ